MGKTRVIFMAVNVPGAPLPLSGAAVTETAYGAAARKGGHDLDSDE